MDVRRGVASFQLPVFSFIRGMYIVVAIFLGSCGITQSEKTVRIALLAPFEGRYREVGYNAYYAAKLALRDYGKTDIELVAVDDGGTIESAADRARALAGDPSVKAAIALGYAATDGETQRAVDVLPMVIVGQWGAKPETQSVFIMANPELDSLITVSPQIDVIDAAKLETPLIGGEVFALEQFSKLRTDLNEVTIVSSVNLPDTTFRERYISSDQFVPEPGLLAPLTYQATQWVLETIIAIEGSSLNRSQIQSKLARDLFRDGYWIDAPIKYYRYAVDGELIAIDRPVE